MVSFSGVLTAATAGWLLAGAGAVIAHEPEHQHERFVAVETGAVLSPRQYHMSPAHAMLEKREGGCNPGLHPCDSIGGPGEGKCCKNTEYCIIDPTNLSAAGCCHIGSRCDSPCPESAYQCDLTRTVTTSGTTSTVTTPGGACCPRVCTGTSQFQCPTSLGGGCCQYNQRCAAGSGSSGSCVFDLTAAPTASIDPGLIPPPGCKTGERSCAETEGGGCCDVRKTCSLIGGQAHCAENPIVPTGSGVSVVDVGGGGLSAGATAGVAVGVVVGVGALVGVGLWWWCVRRRRRRDAVEAMEGVGGGEGMGDGASSVRPRPTGVVGRVVGGSATGGGRAMSDATSDAMSRSGRGGLAQDYFGPAPAVGPYSETHSTSPMTTPGLDRGGVPLQPHGPGDIAVPVEIDSRLREEERTPVGLAITPGTNRSRDSEDATERYELYGSEMGQMSPTWPPYSDGMPSPGERPK